MTARSTYALNESPPKLNVAVDELVQALEAVDDLSELRLGLLEGVYAALRAEVGANGSVSPAADHAAAVVMALDALADAVEGMR